MESRTYRLPKAVYYQCIWTVRDMDRLRRLAMAEERGFRDNEMVFSVDDEEVVRSGAVLKQAKFRMDCIKRALEDVPKEYRQGTIDSIVYNTQYMPTAHENTWRKWRKVFIRRLASEMYLG